MHAQFAHRAAVCFSLAYLFVSSVRGQLLYDARATFDMANVCIDLLARNEHPWVLLQVTPTHNSGSSMLAGTTIDIRTGKTVDSKTGESTLGEGAQPALVEEGSWKVLEFLDQRNGATQGQYSWADQLLWHKHRLEAEDLYAPFSEGGIVLCRYRPDALGAAQFESVYLVPPPWKQSLLLAYDDLRKNSEVTTQQELQVLYGRNPILSVLAFRSLLSANKFDAKSLKMALDKSRGYQRAVFVYLALLSQPNAEQGSYHEIARWIEAVGLPDEDRWKALGIFTFAVLYPELETTQRVVPEFLRAMQDQSEVPGSCVSIDKYLQEILHILSQGQPTHR
jgi:hypothetical protein